MITEPEPTLVMPTSRPPRAPTSMVGIGRIFGSSGASCLAPRTCIRRPTYRRRAYVAAASSSANPMHIFSRWSSSSGLSVTAGDQIGPEQRHRHGPDDQPDREPEVGGPLAVVHDRAAGLVDRRRRQVGGHHGGRLADAQEDQRRRHQRPAAHAGQPDHDADEEACGQDREEGGRDQVIHGRAFGRACRCEQGGERQGVQHAQPSAAAAVAWACCAETVGVGNVVATGPAMAGPRAGLAEGEHLAEGVRMGVQDELRGAAARRSAPGRPRRAGSAVSRRLRKAGSASSPQWVRASAPISALIGWSTKPCVPALENATAGEARRERA